MFRIKSLEARSKQLNYTLINIWKKLCEKDFKDEELYKNYEKCGKKYNIIKQLHIIELELYNLQQLNNILLEVKQDKLDQIVDIMMIVYISTLKDKKKELEDSLKNFSNYYY